MENVGDVFLTSHVLVACKGRAGLVSSSEQNCTTIDSTGIIDRK